MAYAWHEPKVPCQRMVPHGWFERDDAFDLDGYARVLKDQPDGHASFIEWHMQKELIHHPDDVPGFPEIGPQTVFDRFSNLAFGLKERGAPLDVVVCDFEDQMAPWSWSPEDRRRCEAHADFPALAQAMGFSNLDDTIWREGHDPWPFIFKWADVNLPRMWRIQNEVVVEPLQKHYPDVVVSNFNSFVMEKPNLVPDPNGWEQRQPAPYFGTRPNSVVYGSALQVRQRQPQWAWNDPMTGMIWALNRLIAANLNNGGPLVPELAFKSYYGDVADQRWISFADTPYFDALVKHSVMIANASTREDKIVRVFYWNPQGNGGVTGANADDDLAMDRDLLEAERLLVGPYVPQQLIALDAPVVVTECRGRKESKLLVTFREGVSEARVRARDGSRRVYKPSESVSLEVTVKG